jgi:hypothetical protein
MRPPTTAARTHDRLRGDAAGQAGVVSRAQVNALGVTDAAISAHVSARRWQSPHPGVYYLSNGPMTRASTLWAALLWAGSGAALGYESAGERVGLIDPLPADDPVFLVIPWERQASPRPGVVIRRRRNLTSQIRMGAPPCTQVEHTVLDLASSAPTARDAVGWVTRGYRKRLTTPHRLETALNSRVRIRRRRLLTALVASVSPDSESVLEHEYDRVTAAHGLPNAASQRRDTLPAHGGVEGPRRRLVRRDRDYDEYRTVVELDGRLGHEDVADTFRDLDRDNDSQERGHATLRYGYADVFGRPCDVARQVAVVLRHAGWTGSLRQCGPNCTASG